MAYPRARGSQVMSVLRLLVWLVIAVALVKFAFFPPTSVKAGEATAPSQFAGLNQSDTSRGQV